MNPRRHRKPSAFLTQRRANYSAMTTDVPTVLDIDAPEPQPERNDLSPLMFGSGMGLTASGGDFGFIDETRRDSNSVA